MRGMGAMLSEGAEVVVGEGQEGERPEFSTKEVAG